MEDKTQKLNNTIKAVADVLEKNKTKKSVKESYESIVKLKEKRNMWGDIANVWTKSTN